MAEEIEIGHFAVVLDPETFELEPGGFAFFEWMRPINQIAFWIIPAEIIQTTIQVLNVNFGRQISNQQKRRTEENHPPASVIGLVDHICAESRKIIEFGNARKA